MHNIRYRSPLKDGLGWAILLLALALRWPFPSPEWSHVDERALVLYPLGFWSGDFNPHFFNYPTFTLYIASALYYVYFLFFSTQSLEYFVAYRYFVDPIDLLAIARTANTLVSAATVAVCMAVGRRLYGRTGGYLAGVVLAVMPLHARFAHLAITDVAAGLFTALAVLYGVKIVQERRRSDIVLAGVCAGLAAASKYPAGLALVPVLVACLLSRPWREIATRSSLVVLAAPVIAAGLSFVVASPYVLLDWSAFRESFAAMAGEHLLSTSHAGDDPAWWYWLRHNFRYGLGWAGLPVLAVSLLWPTVGRRREEWVVVVGAVVFVLLLLLASSVFMRYAQPLAPLLAILLARSGVVFTSRRGLLAVYLFLVLAEPLYSTARQRSLLGGEDTRAQAQEWLEARVPQGQRYLQVPNRGGRIPMLRSDQIMVRMQPFINSYGIEQMEDSFRLLAEGPELPSLSVDWTLDNYLQGVGQGEPNGEFLVCLYRHPLAQMTHLDSLDWAQVEGQVEWLVGFNTGGATDAAFDQVDWHFVPIGDFALIERSGPDIHIGRLPWYGQEKTATARSFFSAYSLLLAGNKAVKEERWGEAVAAYKAFVDTPYPLNEYFTVKYLYQMFIGTGQSLAALGDSEGAEKAWLRAAKMILSSADPYFHLGLMFADHKDYNRSAEYYIKAAELEPDDVIILFNLGVVLLELGRLQECIAVLERAAVLAPGVDTLLKLTIAYGRNGQLDQARAAFARARALGPQHPQVAAIARAMAQQR